MTTAPTIDPSTRDAIMAMIGHARSGHLQDARSAGKAALPTVGQAAPIHALLGRMACESGDFADGIANLETALAGLPDDPAVRMDLAAAYIHEGRFAEAVAVADEARSAADPTLQLARLRGYAAQQSEDFPAAIAAYRMVVDRQSDDAGTWNNLGNALADNGQPADAVEALQKAITLDPNAPPTHINLANAYFASDRPNEALQSLRDAAVRFPDVVELHRELGQMAATLGDARTSADAYDKAVLLAPDDAQLYLKRAAQKGILWDLDGALGDYRQALSLDPNLPEAYIGLAVISELFNRREAQADLASDARAAGIDEGALRFLDALVLRNEQKWEEALVAAEASSDQYDNIRRLHLIGQLNERLGRSAEAFAAFEAMNKAVSDSPYRPIGLADAYRDQITHNRATLTREWLDRWTPAVPPAADERPSPVFLFGFPRSGTTLLDTMLMGHSNVRVLEEKPAFPNVERSLGPIDNLATMDAAAIREARDRYWAEVAKVEDVPAGTMLVDKSPLYLNKIAYIHRLFPDAKFILALRHPMDVVLSCFITNFRPNAAMANFLDLKRTAEIYDLSFSSFEEADRLLGIPVHPVVYERMVEDRDGELRPLFDWLGLPWEAEAVDHQATAAKRGTITTASYAQVHEPLYKRAAGRWARYREQLQPVADILRPWAERLGYSIDDPEQVPPRATDVKR